jgi:hypothetical protein
MRQINRFIMVAASIFLKKNWYSSETLVFLGIIFVERFQNCRLSGFLDH